MSLLFFNQSNFFLLLVFLLDSFWEYKASRVSDKFLLKTLFSELSLHYSEVSGKRPQRDATFYKDCVLQVSNFTKHENIFNWQVLI